MKNIVALCFILSLISCASLRKLPKKQYYAFSYYFDRSVKNDTVYFTIKNTLYCPVNIKIQSDSLNPGIEKKFGHITLSALQDTTIRLLYPNFNETQSTYLIIQYGDVNQRIEKGTIGYPFPKGREYKVIQGYNGNFSHQTRDSRYALDFNLKVGDTISSADDGYIVGLIEGYKKHGTGKKWRETDKSNYITIYHPHSGLFTKYVHFTYKGALVKLGDWVVKGQPIAISGMTGFTTTPHLHFNVKIPTDEEGLVSTEITFDSGIKGADLNKNDRVK